MSTMAAALVGTDTWNAEVYEAMSFASRLAGMINNKRVALKLSLLLWRLNNRLAQFLESVRGSMTSYQNGTLPLKDVTSSPEAGQDAINSLRKLHSVLVRIEEGSNRIISKTSRRRRGMSHDLLTTPRLVRLRDYDQQVVELADWLEDMQRPERLEALFGHALEEYQRGEFVSLPD